MASTIPQFTVTRRRNSWGILCDGFQESRRLVVQRGDDVTYQPAATDNFHCSAVNPQTVMTECGVTARLSSIGDATWQFASTG